MRGMLALIAGGLLGLGVLRQGDQAFEEGRLDDAIAAWESAGPWASGTVHYDLGNAWYRKGELPLAILHYRAALLRRPRDGHVHHNLAVARADLPGVGPEPVPAPRPWMHAVNISELGALGLALALAASVGAQLGRRRVWRVHPAVWWAMGCLGALAVGVAWEGSWALAERPAAVVAHDAAVRTMPRPDAGERFRLPRGAEVWQIRASEAFVLVEDARGRRGWLPSNAALTVPSPSGE